MTCYLLSGLVSEKNRDVFTPLMLSLLSPLSNL